nr:MAG TPA: hypothetical protein [Caudoviricetes sp.]
MPTGPLQTGTTGHRKARLSKKKQGLCPMVIMM